jgi:hypothetical protein
MFYRGKKLSRKQSSKNKNKNKGVRLMAYKGTLKVSFKDLDLSVPVKYERITSKDIQEQIKVIAKANDGESVIKKFRYIDKTDPTIDKTEEIEGIVARKKVNLGENNGQLYTDDEVRDYQLVEQTDGSIQEVEVSAPSETTNIFEVNDTRPLDSWDSFLPESEYELFGDDQASLKKLADYLVANDIVALFDFQRARTHKPMKAIVKPVFEPNGFALIMRLTMTKYTYKHLLDLTPTQQQVKSQQRVQVKLSV